jgi:hypothetical protein
MLIHVSNRTPLRQSFTLCGFGLNIRPTQVLPPETCLLLTHMLILLHTLTLAVRVYDLCLNIRPTQVLPPETCFLLTHMLILLHTLTLAVRVYDLGLNIRPTQVLPPETCFLLTHTFILLYTLTLAIRLYDLGLDSILTGPRFTILSKALSPKTCLLPPKY